jgi:hypothetical protein
MGKKRKRKRMLNRTGPSTKAPTPGNKNGERKWEARKMTPTKETATRATRRRDPMGLGLFESAQHLL